MFFQLSLPSTPPATDAVGDSALPELGSTGTLTVEALHDGGHEQVARLFPARRRQSRDALHVRVLAGTSAPLTFTAPPLAEAPEEGATRLQ